MANWRKLFIFTVLLPGLAAAADPAMLELIMPDARMVMEVNLDRIVASPIGQAMSDQMKAELQSLRGDWQQPLASLSGLDWNRFAQEVIFASAKPGKDSASLVIVRGLLDPVWIDSLHAFRGKKGEYMGVPVLYSSEGGSMVAFLDGSIAVIGQPTEVKAAIGRRGQNTPPSPVLAEGLDRYEGQYDMWSVSAGGAFAANPKVPAGTALKWLQQVDSFSGGLRFSPDFEVSADMTMRNEKDVAEMASSLKLLSFVGQTQENTASSLDNMKMQVDGKHLTFFLQVPEPQVRAALQQRHVGQRASVMPAAPVRPPEISNGLPVPPTGTIRVQSSDMGTVLVPVDKTP